MTAALARGSFSSHSAMVALNGSSLLVRDRVAGVCAGASRYFLMVCQLMRRWRSILRMGQCSDQYRRCRSLICSVVSMARFPLWGRKPCVDQRAVVGKKDPALLIQ